MRQYVKCEICSENAFQGLMLIGHRATYLCREHTNLYHRFVVENHRKLYEDFHTNNIALAVAVEAKDSETARRLMKEKIWFEDKLYPISDQWVEDQKDI